MSGIYWLASYPKSGNTWLRIFLHNLQVNDGGPADINALNSDAIASARTWLDHLLAFDSVDLGPDAIEALRPACYEWAAHEASKTGYHKIHDANLVGHPAAGALLVTAQACRGVLYIVRNPLDLAPSAASHWNVSVDVAITRLNNPAFALLPSDSEPRQPQVRQRLLDWSGHVRSWVDAPGLRVHVARYEDLLADPVQHFARVASFLELPSDADRVRSAVEASRFEALVRQETARGFKERPTRQARFFRSGRAGAWRDSLDAAQVARIVDAHGPMMRRFGYLGDDGQPV